MNAPSAEAEEWHRIVRASVRECLETWGLQAQAGSVSLDALETLLARATVPILRQVEGRPPELVVALLPEPDPHHARSLRGSDGRAEGGEAAVTPMMDDPFYAGDHLRVLRAGGLSVHRIPYPPLI